MRRAHQRVEQNHDDRRGKQLTRDDFCVETDVDSDSGERHETLGVHQDRKQTRVMTLVILVAGVTAVIGTSDGLLLENWSALAASNTTVRQVGTWPHHEIGSLAQDGNVVLAADSFVSAAGRFALVDWTL